MSIQWCLNKLYHACLGVISKRGDGAILPGDVTLISHYQLERYTVVAL
jgi:hypothetical protein